MQIIRSLGSGTVEVERLVDSAPSNDAGGLLESDQDGIQYVRLFHADL